MAEHESLVTVGTFTTVGEAEAARLMLESRGITCFLADAEMIGEPLYNLRPIAQFAIGLQTRSADAWSIR